MTLPFGNSLTVQWLGLYAFTAGTQFQLLVGELRAYKLHGTAKNKKKALTFILNELGDHWTITNM